MFPIEPHHSGDCHFGDWILVHATSFSVLLKLSGENNEDVNLSARLRMAL